MTVRNSQTLVNAIESAIARGDWKTVRELQKIARKNEVVNVPDVADEWEKNNNEKNSS